MIKKKVSAIILNWNGKQFLADCLNSLLEQTLDNYEVILVENGSTDGSADFIKTAYPWVRLIELSENLGFAEGNNRGLEACRGEYIVTLNNDTKVDPGFLTELVNSIDENDKIGMVAAKLLNFYETDRIDAIGVKVAKYGLGYNIGVGELDAGQYDEPMAAFGPCAGAALYRREMIDEIGFFDPDFFAYYEDLDLAWRGRLAGWRCVTSPKAVVYHVHSATSGKGSPFTVFHIHRNKWYTILKNWPNGLLLKRLPTLLVVDLAAFALAIIRGRGGAALKARVDVVRNLRKLWRKRRKVQQCIRITSMDMEALFTPAESPWQTLVRKMTDK